MDFVKHQLLTNALHGGMQLEFLVKETDQLGRISIGLCASSPDSLEVLVVDTPKGSADRETGAALPEHLQSLS
jgi:hypothetical protein